MLSEEQIKKIYCRRLATIREFFNDMTLSDESLASILLSKKIETSSSTVGRDLTSIEIISILKDIFPDSDSTELFESIQLARQANKASGHQKGGNNYTQNNIAVKDENGKFTGSISR